MNSVYTMKTLVSGLLLAASWPLQSARALPQQDLKTGDVLLISLPCHLCSIIEAEEGAPFSHIGVVLLEGGRITVLDSYQKVEQSLLENFVKLAKPGTRPLVLRAVGPNRQFIEFDPADVARRFHGSFEGLHYDSQFLWNNRDGTGEKLYCSEFAAKFLGPYLSRPLRTKPMHYRVQRDEWIRFFKGNPPDGLPGISPADFSRSPAFRSLGELD